MSPRSLALGAMATLSLGVPFLLISVAQEAMATPVMAAGRMVVAACTLWAVAVARGRAHSVGTELIGLARLRPVSAAVVALTATVAPNLLLGAAEQHVPTGATAVVVATTPVWIAAGAVLTRSGERVASWQWVALAAAVAGTGLAVGAATPETAWGWLLLPLAAALSYAVSSLVLRRRLPGASPLAVALAETVAGSLVLVPFAAVFPGALRWDAGAWAAVAVLGAGCSGLGWLANTALIQRAGAARASVVSYTAVVVSVMLGVIVRGEPFTPRVLAGIAVLIVSVTLFTAGSHVRLPLTRKARRMLELCILGFLADSPMHAYDLRRRISALTGHVRKVSDGALTPALRRLEGKGLIRRGEAQPGSGGPPRHVFELTAAGHEDLLRRLTAPADIEISDRSRYFTILAFLHHVPSPGDRRRVLERRLAFLDEPACGFFVPEDRPPAGPATSYRDGMRSMAAVISAAERDWLHAALAEAS